MDTQNTFSSPVSFPPPESSSFLTGAVAWFSLSGSELRAFPGPSAASDIPLPNIREVAPKTSGDMYPVLALRSTQDGSGAQTAFGTVDANGAFLPFDGEGLFKEGLVPSFQEI